MGKDFERLLRESIERMVATEKRSEEKEEMRLQNLEAEKEKERRARKAEAAKMRNVIDKSDPHERRRFEVLEALQVKELLQGVNSIICEGRGEILPVQGASSFYFLGPGYVAGSGGGFSAGSYVGGGEESVRVSGFVLVDRSGGMAKGMMYAGFVWEEDSFEIIEPVGHPVAASELEVSLNAKFLNGTSYASSYYSVEAASEALDDPSKYDLARREVQEAFALKVRLKMHRESKG